MSASFFYIKINKFKILNIEILKGIDIKVSFNLKVKPY
ncbi:hypothetical protein M211_1917 [Acinetobacter lactucae]|nr:hypothetical protein M211_1917 [Acinetobacter lactucae]